MPMFRYVLCLLLLTGLARAELTTQSLLATIKSGKTPTALPCPGGGQTDLWILAGQSNMVGVGLIKQPQAPDPRVWVLRMSNEWQPATDPLHQLAESVFGAHRKTNKWTPEKQMELLSVVQRQRQTPGFIRRGVGPGLPFARRLAEVLDHPIGLIATAHGGTSLRQWDPALKSAGTDSLYGAMLERVRLAQAGGKGGTLRGMLWYQGESDAISPQLKLTAAGTSETVAASYERQWLAFVDAVRRDLNAPDLPIIYVQIARVTTLQNAAATSTGLKWEDVREAQRLCAAKRKHLYVVPAIDLAQDDAIHLSGDSQQRLGRRLAEVALGQVYQRPGHATAITLDTIETVPQDPHLQSAGFTIKLKFKGVNGRLRSGDRPTGFALRRPKGNDLYRVDFDPNEPNVVLLQVTPPWVPQTRLVYAPGVNPFANIVDERDMALPAFGPLPVPDPPQPRPAH